MFRLKCSSEKEVTSFIIVKLVLKSKDKDRIIVIVKN